MHAIHLPFIYPRPAPQTDLFPRDTAGFPSPSSPPSSRPPPSWSVTQTPFAQAPIARTPLLGPPAPSDPIALGSYLSRSDPKRSAHDRSGPLSLGPPSSFGPARRSDPVAQTHLLGPNCSDPIARTQSLGPRRPVSHRSDPIAWTIIVHTLIAQTPIARAPTPAPPPLL